MNAQESQCEINVREQRPSPELQKRSIYCCTHSTKKKKLVNTNIKSGVTNYGRIKASSRVKN